jgi:hypothetical protein
MSNETDLTTPRFADVYGTPGQSPRTLGPLRVFWPLALFCLAAGWLLHAALPAPTLTQTTAGFLFLILAVLLTVFTAWSARRLKSFIKGAEGEEFIARRLSFLPAPYSIFNDFQLDAKGPSFDHIVIGPAGVFVIETKNWTGEITFRNGQVLCNDAPPSRPPIRQVKDAAAALINHLSAAQCPDVPIQPVLCFVNNDPADKDSNIGGVRICTDRTLNELFENTLTAPPERGTLAMITAELKRCIEEK